MGRDSGNQPGTAGPVFSGLVAGRLLFTMYGVCLSLVLTGCSGDESSPETETPGKDRRMAEERNMPFLGQVDNPRYKSQYMGKKLTTFADYLAAARDAQEKNAYYEAYQFARKAAALEDRSGEAHYIIGVGLCASAYGDEDEALAELKRAIDLGFEDGNLYEYMAKIYDGKKQYGEAVKALTRAIELRPTDIGLYGERAAMYVFTGDLKQAEKDYTRRIEMSDSRRSESLLIRGRFYEGQKRYEEALADYTAAVEHDLRETDELRARVGALVALGRRKEAVEDLDEIIERNPNDDDSIRTRGNLYFELGNLESALKDFSTAIQHSPDQDRLAYEARARVYDRLGRKDRAEADRKAAREIADAPAEKPIY
ncbi:MAG: tetratricopeptide repeat protein [Candidatus Melainabacteria bacterium]|nr:tetratricopeptide repeat protein [Candidatus Melainabacteria bacterium]